MSLSPLPPRPAVVLCEGWLAKVGSTIDNQRSRCLSRTRVRAGVRSRCRRSPWWWCWCWAGDRELEFADARKPIAVYSGLVIFVRVPEGDAVNGVDCSDGIVAPATEVVQLGTVAVSHYCFALTKVVQRIRSKTPGITNACVHG